MSALIPPEKNSLLTFIIERVRLLIHILCELRTSHDITAEKLKEAGQDVRRQISPVERLEVLDEIYYVRQMEEHFMCGDIGTFGCS